MLILFTFFDWHLCLPALIPSSDNFFLNWSFNWKLSKKFRSQISTLLLCNRSDANFSTILCNKRFFNIESFLKLPSFHFLPSFLCTPIDTIYRKNYKETIFNTEIFLETSTFGFPIFQVHSFWYDVQNFLTKKPYNNKDFFYVLCFL